MPSSMHHVESLLCRTFAMKNFTTTFLQQAVVDKLRSEGEQPSTTSKRLPRVRSFCRPLTKDWLIGEGSRTPNSGQSLPLRPPTRDLQCSRRPKAFAMNAHQQQTTKCLEWLNDTTV